MVNFEYVAIIELLIETHTVLGSLFPRVAGRGLDFIGFVVINHEFSASSYLRSGMTLYLKWVNLFQNWIIVRNIIDFLYLFDFLFGIAFTTLDGGIPLVLGFANNLVAEALIKNLLHSLLLLETLRDIVFRVTISESLLLFCFMGHLCLICC